MRPVDEMRAVFSRYELAVMGQLAPLAVGVAAIVLMGLGYLAGGFILLLVAGVVAVAFMWISACPECGKSPWYMDAGGWQLWRFGFGIGRFWPERECSHCGTRLDVI